MIQVCNLVWSKNVNELVSTHGYSQNQVVVWSYPSMNQVLYFIQFILFLKILCSQLIINAFIADCNIDWTHNESIIPCCLTWWPNYCYWCWWWDPQVLECFPWCQMYVSFFLKKNIILFYFLFLFLFCFVLFCWLIIIHCSWQFNNNMHNNEPVTHPRRHKIMNNGNEWKTLLAMGREWVCHYHSVRMIDSLSFLYFGKQKSSREMSVPFLLSLLFTLECIHLYCMVEIHCTLIIITIGNKPINTNDIFASNF